MCLWVVCDRWTTVGWPHKMMQMIEQVSLQWEEDEERFRKLQLSDLTTFNDRIDALTVSISHPLLSSPSSSSSSLSLSSSLFSSSSSSSSSSLSSSSSSWASSFSSFVVVVVCRCRHCSRRRHCRQCRRYCRRFRYCSRCRHCRRRIVVVVGVIGIVLFIICHGCFSSSLFVVVVCRCRRHHRHRHRHYYCYHYY